MLVFVKGFLCVCIDMRGGNLDDVENEVGRSCFFEAEKLRKKK